MTVIAPDPIDIRAEVIQHGLPYIGQRNTARGSGQKFHPKTGFEGSNGMAEG